MTDQIADINVNGRGPLVPVAIAVKEDAPGALPSGYRSAI